LILGNENDLLARKSTLFVRGDDVSFIEKVIFVISELVHPNKITVVSSPFQITFDYPNTNNFLANVEIHYRPGCQLQTSGSTTLSHHVNLEAPGSTQQIVIN